MPKISFEFTITNTQARRYLRDFEAIDIPTTTKLVASLARVANRAITPRKTGKLQRSLRLKRIRRYAYQISWIAEYSSYVDEKPKFAFSQKVIARTKREINAAAKTYAASRAARASRNSLPAPNPIVQLINMYRQPGLIGVPP